MINFKAKLSKIGSWTILKLPKDASAKLPSRGLVMIKGTINNTPFKIPLEPDGKGSHWFKIEKSIGEKIKADVGDTLTLSIEPIKEWLEPQLPSDLKNALSHDSKADKLWKDITPMARWDFIRWINSTKNPETRKLRIEKTLSKLMSGKRAVCCFNRAQCTDTEVSDKGVLL